MAREGVVLQRPSKEYGDLGRCIRGSGHVSRGVARHA